MKDSKTSSESTIKEFEIAVRNAEEKIDQITADSELVQSKVEKCLAIAKVIMGLGIAVSLKIGVVVSQKSEKENLTISRLRFSITDLIK